MKPITLTQQQRFAFLKPERPNAAEQAVIDWFESMPKQRAQIEYTGDRDV